MKFSYQYSPADKKIEISLHRDSSLDSVIDAFEAFLRDAGYSFDGHIDVIENKVYESKEGNCA